MSTAAIWSIGLTHTLPLEQTPMPVEMTGVNKTTRHDMMMASAMVWCRHDYEIARDPYAIHHRHVSTDSLHVDEGMCWTQR